MAVAKKTLLAVLLIALNNNVAAFMPAASTRVSYHVGERIFTEELRNGTCFLGVKGLAHLT